MRQSPNREYLKKQSKSGKKLELIAFIDSIDYKFTRNLPLYEIEKIVKRKSEVCNWCGLEKKMYFCCDEDCHKNDFLCAECSIEWLEHPHYMHQFLYIIPLLSSGLLNNHDQLIKSYVELKNIEIKANFHIVQKLSKFYEKIEEQIAVIEEQKGEIKIYLKKVEQILNDHESKLTELSKAFKGILKIVSTKNIKQKQHILKKMEFQLVVITSKLPDNSKIALHFLKTGADNDETNDISDQKPSTNCQIQELITSKSIINFANKNENYHKISKFYSDNLKGMSMRLICPSENILTNNSFYLFQNIVALELTGQTNFSILLTLLSNPFLKSLKLDYITVTPKKNQQISSLPYEDQENNEQIQQQIIPLNVQRKYCSNLLSMQIKYPSTSPILSLFRLCSFPQMCRLEMSEVYEAKNVLQEFIKDILIRLPRLEYLGLATYLGKQAIEEVIQQTFELRYAPINEIMSTASISIFNGGYSNRKKRYQIHCIDRINVMMREIQFDDMNIQNGQVFPRQNIDQLLGQGNSSKLESSNYFRKTRILYSLIQYYRKKNPNIKSGTINDLFLYGIL